MPKRRTLRQLRGRVELLHKTDGPPRADAALDVFSQFLRDRVAADKAGRPELLLACTLHISRHKNNIGGSPIGRRILQI